MPYPSQIDAERVLAMAVGMVREEGADALSLHRVAAALHVKTPSLYRYFAGKAELMKAINEVTMAALLDALTEALGLDDTDEEGAIEGWMHLFDVYRQFAHAHSQEYGLLFTNTLPGIQPDSLETERRVLPLQARMAQITGEANALAALRGAFSLAHGFVMLELCGQFRREGDLETAYSASVRAYLAGWRG